MKNLKKQSHWYVVKWYNPYKGYGFIVNEDTPGTSDIFLHFSVLENLNLLQVRPGDKVLCNVGPTENGSQVTEIFEIKPINPFILDSNRLKQGKRLHLPRFMKEKDTPHLEEVNAEIKWFSRIKGFGFACSKDITDDIFIHGALLNEAHIENLKPGQKVHLWIALCDNKPEARKIALNT